MKSSISNKQDSSSKPRRIRSIVLLPFGISFFFFLIILVEITCGFFIQGNYLSPKTEDFQSNLYRWFFSADPLLGHRGRPYVDYKMGQRHNNLGLRGKDVSLVKDSSSFRVGIFGDSQVWGWALADSSTIPVHLEKVSKEMRITRSKTIEAVNFGVPGYSIDQEYLQFLMFADTLKLDAAVLVVFLTNDLGEIVTDKAWEMPRPQILPKVDGTVGSVVLEHPPLFTGDEKFYGTYLGDLMSLGAESSNPFIFSNFLTVVAQRTVSPGIAQFLCNTFVRKAFCDFYNSSNQVEIIKNASPIDKQQKIDSFGRYEAILDAFTVEASVRKIPLIVAIVPPVEGLQSSDSYQNYLKIRSIIKSSSNRAVIDMLEVIDSFKVQPSHYSLDGYHYNSAFNAVLSVEIAKKLPSSYFKAKRGF
jgi:hypothetical protein